MKNTLVMFKNVLLSICAGTLMLNSVSRNAHAMCAQYVSPYSDKTVLVVDDAPAHITLRKGSFERLGFGTILIASSAEEALLVIAARAIDLISTDKDMGNMSGPDLIRHLRQMGNLTPAIIVTGGWFEEADREIPNTRCEYKADLTPEMLSQWVDELLGG